MPQAGTNDCCCCCCCCEGGGCWELVDLLDLPDLLDLVDWFEDDFWLSNRCTEEAPDAIRPGLSGRGCAFWSLPASLFLASLRSCSASSFSLFFCSAACFFFFFFWPYPSQLGDWQMDECSDLLSSSESSPSSSSPVAGGEKVTVFSLGVISPSSSSSSCSCGGGGLGWEASFLLVAAMAFSLCFSLSGLGMVMESEGGPFRREACSMGSLSCFARRRDSLESRRRTCSGGLIWGGKEKSCSATGDV